MNWDRLARGFRRALGHLKSIYEKAVRSEDDSTLGGKGWSDSGGRPRFPQDPEPRFAPIRK